MFFTEDSSVANGFPLFKTINLDKLGITDGNFNLDRYKWEGDFDNGQIIDTFLQKQVVVTEEEIDGKYREILLRKYALDKILCSIVLNIPESTDDDFNNIKRFITRLEENKKQEIEFYKKSEVHKFETWNDILNREQETFKQ